MITISKKSWSSAILYAEMTLLRFSFCSLFGEQRTLKNEVKYPKLLHKRIKAHEQSFFVDLFITVFLLILGAFFSKLKMMQYFQCTESDRWNHILDLDKGVSLLNCILRQIKCILEISLHSLLTELHLHKVFFSIIYNDVQSSSRFSC